jgi:hypothetical protein
LHLGIDASGLRRIAIGLHRKPVLLVQLQLLQHVAAANLG